MDRLARNRRGLGRTAPHPALATRAREVMGLVNLVRPTMSSMLTKNWAKPRAGRLRIMAPGTPAITMRAMNQTKKRGSEKSPRRGRVAMYLALIFLTVGIRKAQPLTVRITARRGALPMTATPARMETTPVSVMP